MDSTSAHFTKLHKPSQKKPYARGCMVLLFLALGIFFSISIASGIYVYTVYKGLRSEKITPEQIFGRPQDQKTNGIFGKGRPIVGRNDAPIVFVVFIDYECEFCREASGAINAFIRDPYYKDKARFVIRQFPVTKLHPHALEAALGAECAHEQGKFLEMNNALFDAKESLSSYAIKNLAKVIGLNTQQFNSCFDEKRYIDVIKSDMSDGIDAGIQSTPVFLIKDRIIEGAPTLENIKQAVDYLSSSR